MHALARPLARTRTLIVLAVAALTAVALVLVSPFSQSAKADGSAVTGTFSFTGSLIIGCPPGALLCTTGHLHGGIEAPFTLTLLSTAPTGDQGILFFTGRLVAKAPGGNLVCLLHGAENAKTGSDGEFGEICEFNGGTGAYAKAKGNLRMIGTSTQNLLVPTGGGIYQGSLTTS